MKYASLKSTLKGWFVSGFSGAIYNANFETGVKRYKAGEKEASHYHKLSDEITVIISGKVEMNGITYVEDDVIIIEAGESANFIALEDSVTVIVKPTYTTDSDKYEN